MVRVANRDESAFADPFRFDIGRDPNEHVELEGELRYSLQGIGNPIVVSPKQLPVRFIPR